MPGRQYAYACGVPTEKCCGSVAKVNKGCAGLIRKTHGSAQAAFDCMKSHLIKQGYTKIGSREFSPPDGGPVRVLTKRRRYGGKFRPGKEGRVRAGGNRPGVIIG